MAGIKPGSSALPTNCATTTLHIFSQFVLSIPHLLGFAQLTSASTLEKPINVSTYQV